MCWREVLVILLRMLLSMLLVMLILLLLTLRAAIIVNKVSNFIDWKRREIKRKES